MFISHGESAFDDEDMFPDEKKRETKAWEKKPKVSVLSNIPDIPLDEPAADDDEIFESMRRDTERRADGLRAENANQTKLQSQTKLQRLRRRQRRKKPSSRRRKKMKRRPEFLYPEKDP
mgnify:CR=1 FL=1